MVRWFRQINFIWSGESFLEKARTLDRTYLSEKENVSMVSLGNFDQLKTRSEIFRNLKSASLMC
jgi:hypothetical protein